MLYSKGEAGQADHPADHAAGGAIVPSDEARVQQLRRIMDGREWIGMDLDEARLAAREWIGDSSQSIQPGIVLATGTEAGQADHPADHEAGGAIVASDEARVAAIEEEWERQLTCEEEAAELEAAFEAGAKAAREWIGVAANREWIGMARELIGMAAREGDKDLKQELKQDLRQELKLPGVVSLVCL